MKSYMPQGRIVAASSWINIKLSYLNPLIILCKRWQWQLLLNSITSISGSSNISTFLKIFCMLFHKLSIYEFVNLKIVHEICSLAKLRNWVFCMKLLCSEKEDQLQPWNYMWSNVKNAVVVKLQFLNNRLNSIF